MSRLFYEKITYNFSDFLSVKKQGKKQLLSSQLENKSDTENLLCRCISFYFRLSVRPSR